MLCHLLMPEDVEASAEDAAQEPFILHSAVCNSSLVVHHWIRGTKEIPSHHFERFGLWIGCRCCEQKRELRLESAARLIPC